jgi:MFS family permease
VLQDAHFGWVYIADRKGLIGLLIFFAISNLVLSMVQSVLPPLVLSFSTTQTLSFIVSTSGIGMLAGTLLMTAWGGPAQKIKGILLGTLLQGVALVLCGLTQNVVVIAASIFIFMLNIPVIFACSQSIWQSKVPPELQGRVFAIRRVAAWISTPVTFIVIGPLVDRVFDPLLQEGGLAAPNIGTIIGVGPGRGIGLLIILVGLCVLCAVYRAYYYPPLRHVESELQDSKIVLQSS